MKLINRDTYLTRIKRLLGRNLIICLTGQRRVGKSSIMKTLVEELQQDTHSNVIYIDKEKTTFDNLITNTDLNEYILQHTYGNKHNYVLIDEVQLIRDFERSLTNFYDQPNYDLIVTGSNAKMFSGELATRLTGRYIEVHIQSLNYEEFLIFMHLSDSDEALLKYLTIGGLPNISLLPDDEDLIHDYLNSVYNTILLKDILLREQVRNTTFLDNLVHFVAQNTGKLFSANNISKYMTHLSENINPSLVRNYMDFLCNAFILNKVQRYDIRGKQLLANQEKYYFEDIGLRNMLVGMHTGTDIEQRIENVVYLKLKSLGYQVYVGMLRNAEVDFVATKNSDIIYVQATYLLGTEQTIQRECGNLMMIKNNYPKYVVSMSPLTNDEDYDGIKHLHLRTFLKQQEL